MGAVCGSSSLAGRGLAQPSCFEVRLVTGAVGIYPEGLGTLSIVLVLPSDPRYSVPTVFGVGVRARLSDDQVVRSTVSKRNFGQMFFEYAHERARPGKTQGASWHSKPKE